MLYLWGMSLAASTYFKLERLKKKYIQNKMQSKTPLDLISRARIHRYLDCFYVFGSYSRSPKMILCFTWGPVFISMCHDFQSKYQQFLVITNHLSWEFLAVKTNKQNLWRRKKYGRWKRRLGTKNETRVIKPYHCLI